MMSEQPLIKNMSHRYEQKKMEMTFLADNFQLDWNFHYREGFPSNN